jgi:NAD(P)-dependent dehydrogenase (short-subunit alcohol dehydrogenase family)
MLISMSLFSEAEFQAQMDTNTTGTFRCIKGALPYFRSLQSTGGATIVNITTMVAIAPYPATAAYAASKCAVEGLSDALAQEVGAFGVRVIIAAPGITRTNFLRDFIKPAAGLNEAYVGGSVDATVSALAGLSGKQPGDPERAGRQIINIVDGTENGKEFQGKGIGEVLRIALGSDCFDTCTAKLASLSEAFKLTEKVARSGDFDSQ